MRVMCHLRVSPFSCHAYSFLSGLFFVSTNQLFSASQPSHAIFSAILLDTLTHKMNTFTGFNFMILC